MSSFPSIEWFESLRSLANEDREFNSLGSCNAQVGVKVSEEIYLLNFEGFECTAVSDGDEVDLLDADFYLDMELRDWKSLLTNIAQNDGADSEHTFNTLDIENGVVSSSNPYGLNSFPMYHLTIQRFFDLSARLGTA